MNWLMLVDENQLADIYKLSFNPANKGILLFKHSTRCSVSSMALDRLDRSWNVSSELLPRYCLDLLNHRPISFKIAHDYGLPHESPQVLIIKNGKCIYTASHSSISYTEIQKFINQ